MKANDTPRTAPVEPDLATLIERIAGGDQAAFRQLYNNCFPRLYTIVRRLLVRSELAEEVVQDTFVTLWERAGDYDRTRAHPVGWLAAIARNRALDMLRRPRLELPIQDDAWLDSVASNVGSAESQYEGRVASAALNAALADLVPSQRQAIALAFHHGLTHSEIAAHLGRPLGTVKTLVRRGMARLARTLGEAPQLGAPSAL